MALSKENFHSTAGKVAEKLMASLQVDATRRAFFKTLSHTLQEYFHFDRLCINLYDREGGMLTYFTAAEGTLISTLSPVRPAETSSTVAGHVIANRKPVIITDFAEYFSESTIHPVAEAGLSATMAFPLILNSEIVATLHCSFAEKPENIYDIATFLADLCPAVATCLGSILSKEQFDLQRKNLRPQFASATEEPFVYHSQAMREIMRKIDANACLDIPVLILGESGTGKTVIAQEIHRRSSRSKGGFVKVNCPSLPSTLFESELFGHARGAFTGAGTKRVGRVEMAHGGTLFLDEIAELSSEMQSKLLQVLEDSSFERVGESVSLAVDVRFVAATNVDVSQAMDAGRLRRDLFYRLAACVIEMPPLRDHKEDIPTLVSALSRQISHRLGLPVVRFAQALLNIFLDHHWPGNIRELRNVLTRLTVLNNTQHGVGEDDVRLALREAEYRSTPMEIAAVPASPQIDMASPAETASPASTGNKGSGWGVDTLAEAERKHILKVLTLTNGVIAGPNGAATLLDLPRTTLQHRMRKLGIAGVRGKSLPDPR